MCRPATARAVTVGGTLLAVVVGLTGWVGTSSGADGQVGATVVRLTGGVEGTGHPAMSAAMPGMNMSAARSDPSEGAYLTQTPHGSARLSQSGGHLLVSVTVSGLPPGSHHAAGIVIGASRCSSAAQPGASSAFALPGLVANPHGVAQIRADLTLPRQVIAHGYAIRVDRDPTVAEIDDVGSVTSSVGLARSFTRDPAVLCGVVGGQ